MFPQTHHVECVAVLDHVGVSTPVILASSSPRRRELLSDMGLQFQVVSPEIDEEPLPGESTQDTASRLSLAKALAVASRFDAGYVVGADSMVVLEGRPMGKPADASDARRMLRELRDTRHQVTTGVTVVDAALGRRLTDTVTSYVKLRNFTDAEIEASIASGMPLDKAGAYAVQDEALRPAESWEGCYSNIVGLPLCRVSEMLAELGCELPGGGDASRTGQCGPTCHSQGGKRP